MLTKNPTIGSTTEVIQDWRKTEDPVVIICVTAAAEKQNFTSCTGRSLAGEAPDHIDLLRAVFTWNIQYFDRESEKHG
jgi:hypothetical protein